MYSSGMPGLIKAFSATQFNQPGLGFIDLNNPSDRARYDQYEQAQGAGLQAAINSGSVAGAAILSQPNGLQTLSNQTIATKQIQAGNLAIQGAADAALTNSQAQLNTTQGGATATQADANAALTTEQSAATAANTYQQIQGGGVSAQLYTAMPYLIGGVLVLGLIGWIIYANKKKR